MRVRTFVRPFLVVLRNKSKVFFSERNLLYTNIGISVGISVFGDSIQQIYQQCKTPRKAWTWDFQRSMQMAGAGFMSAPFVHYWYYYLDKFLPGKSVKTVMKKLFLDQFVCSPIYIVLFLISTGILERQSWEEFKKECRDKALGLVYIEFLVWPPAQFINFFFLPTQYRVLFDNIFSLLVDALYSYVRFDYKGDSETEEEVDHDDNNDGYVKQVGDRIDDDDDKELPKSSLPSDCPAVRENEANVKRGHKLSDIVIAQRLTACTVADNFHHSCIILDF